MKKTLAIGMDFGGTNCRFALINRRAEVVARVSCATNQVSQPKEFMRWSKLAVTDLLAKAGCKKSSVAGLGMGLPGSVDAKRGLVHSLTNLPSWNNIQLASLMKKNLNLPVSIDNDANAMALGEFLHGAAKGSQNAIFLTLGTGIGGGLLIDGKLFNGHRFSAAEIGHMRWAGHPINCACGSRGCIETVVGNGYLLRRLKKDFKDKMPTKVKRAMLKDNQNQIKLEHITRAAKAGDVYSIRFWKEIGESLGDFLGGLCNMLNPEVIVIGGGIMGAGSHIVNPLKTRLKACTFEQAYIGLKVVKAKLGVDAGLIGAANLILRKI
ncbi:MAG: glucokinase [Candidatus Omnitrophota bacterium]|jgi:glucokinase